MRSVLVFGVKLRDLRVDLFHIEALHGVDDLLQRGAWQCTSLVEDQNAFLKAISVGIPSMLSAADSP